MTKETYDFIAPHQAPAQVIGTFIRFYGPTMNAFGQAETKGKGEELNIRLTELAKSQNRGTNGGTFIPATFLRVTVRV